AGAAAVEIDPSSADLLLGPHWRTGLEEVARRHMDGQDWLPAPLRPAASAEIMVNNVQVSFLAFASGVLLCLGSLYVMGFNGILMGAVAGIVHRHGVDLPFWGFVAPHGAIELPAIMIAGGAGMVMGWSLLRPGRLLRREALRLAARRAVVLLMGVVVMLALAGVIEGFLSPRVDLPDGFKLALGGGIFACLAGWLGLAGRGAARPSGPVWKQPHPLFDLPAAGEAEALEAGPAGAKGKAPELSAPESAW
ncbi:MAG TPA: stage II sporulation protein M, partial [Candidatus Nitrosotenuis sp.]|nr:stage II sporulation protein M [Candidatus Nitrosotenuis sp.]